MKLVISNPQKVVFECEGLISVQCPSEDGLFQILHNHAPMMAVIAKGQLKCDIYSEKKPLFIDVNPGILHVSDNIITILSES
ncbi:MAG: hypothetical protein FWC98_03980 [Bacteroidales bacterium]|nr:hypothetical protein [Bacteroidales bacterium]